MWKPHENILTKRRDLKSWSSLKDFTRRLQTKNITIRRLALKDLLFIQEFRELIKTLDQTVEKERLESSLRIVSEAEES